MTACPRDDRIISMCSFGGFPHDKFVKSLLAQVGSLVISLKAPWACTTMKGNMKEIIYKGKKVKVPFEDANYTLDGDKDVTIENRFGGEKCTMPGYAAAVYDVIIGAEATKRYDLVEKGCDWFSRNFPKQYMVLLD